MTLVRNCKAGGTELSATQQRSSETTATPARRVAWAILILITLYICYFSHLGVIGFVGPDEPRYAWIARDMAETGDWVTPRLYGKPWFEKPPLLYWGGAIFFKLFGGHEPEVAARLPSAISALLATVTLAWLAWRTYGEECARWLLLLLPTSVGTIGFSHAAATDMPFAGMLTIAMVCAAIVLGLTQSEDTPILPHTPWLALLLFGFFLGLAALAKGPVAIILSGGSVFFWATFTKRWRNASRLLHPIAVASFCLTSLPWYILCARRNPDFLHVFIIEHNLKRFFTPEFQHIQPFWYYGPILLIACLPWSVALVAAIILGLQTAWERRQASSLAVFLLCWSAFCLIFFSISRSKLPGYILPVIPVIALLFARTASLTSRDNPRPLRYFSMTAALVLLVTSGVMAYIAHAIYHTSPLNGNFAKAISVVAFLLAVANSFFPFAIPKSDLAHAKTKILAATGMVLPILVAMLIAQTLVPYVFPWDPSGKTVAQEISLHGIPLNQLTIHGMNRGMHLSVSFYLRREIPDWDPAAPKESYLLLGGLGCKYVVEETAICEEPPLFLEASGRFLYRVRLSPSLDRPGRGREPKQKE